MDPVKAIETVGLSKGYDGARGIEDVTLSVEAGKSSGSSGPTGPATTTIRTLLDLLHPSAGSAAIFGLDSRRDSVAIRARLGNPPGTSATASGPADAKRWRCWRSCAGSTAASAPRSWARRFRADLGRPLGELSRGNRQKVGLILAVFHRPSC